MTSIKIGNINKISENRYVVSLFRRKLRKEFATLDEAVQFSKHHAIGILSTNETSAVSVRYEREDKRASFLIWERDSLEHECSFLEYEESAYDYVITHPTSFPKHFSRRIINERYYSFHDFARINVLTSGASAFWKIFVNGLAFIASIVLLFYGLHAGNLSDEAINSPSSQKFLVSLCTVGISVSTLIVATASMFSYGRPLYKLNKVKWEYDDIDWRKLNVFRKRLKLVVYAFMGVGIGFTVYLFLNIWDMDLWVKGSNNEGFYFIIFAIINSSFLAIISLLAGINSLVNRAYFRRNIVKYFNEEEIAEYKRWIKNKEAKVYYKTDKKYFVYDYDKNLETVLAKIEMTAEVERTSTVAEMREYKKKAIRHYKIALDLYERSGAFK